ncbi:MAG: cysteine hydrolase family protein [Candidatus Marsarchaeota archaeon]|nr:cysteine hydrolase family protein [Candidatus Marsarchaeota archaeon]
MALIDASELKSFINPKRTALLVIDIQRDYCANDGVFAEYFKFHTENLKDELKALGEFVDMARDIGITVIWTKMVEDPKQLQWNIAEFIKHGNAWKDHINICKPKTRGFEYYVIGPKKGDIEIVKKNYSAFYQNTGLDRKLRSRKINTVIFTGTIASRCVDTSIRDAFDSGYRCIVPEEFVLSYPELAAEKKSSMNVWNHIFAYVVKAEDMENAFGVYGKSGKR